MATYQILRQPGENESFRLSILDPDIKASLKLSEGQLSAFIRMLTLVADGSADSIAVQL